MRPSLFFLILLLLLTVLGATAVGQHGAMTAPRNLAEMTEQADLIVQARVVSAVAEPHPRFSNLSTVLVTLVVEDTLKGTAPRLHTFRQFVWDERDRSNVLGYRKGQEVLLLLNRVNENGLTSPVGVQQGRFRIVRGAAGEATAVNGHRNHALFDGVSERARQSGVRLSTRGAQIAATREPGPVSLQDLKELIRGFARSEP